MNLYKLNLKMLSHPCLSNATKARVREWENYLAADLNFSERNKGISY